MKVLNNYEFKVSISREGYEDKETAKMCLSSVTAKKINKVKMAFKEQEVTVQEFITYATNGYAFCNLFKFDKTKKYWIKSGKHYTQTYPVYKNGLNKGYFKLNFKSDEFFAGSQTIFVDIDYTHFQEITDYINCLTFKPTCVYTSFSDKVNKGGITSRRFRLVYVFDSILTATEFKNVTFTLYDSIVADTQEAMYDSCGCSYSQYMNGSNSSEAYISNLIYSVTDFPTQEGETIINEVKPVKSKKIEFTEELVNDMQNLPYKFVVEKWYAKGLRYITKSKIDFKNNYYTTTTDDYISLFYHKEKVADGNKRRKKLFLRAALRRLMKPTITPDELLYNLFIDRERFFDNSDNVLSVEILQNKVKGAFRTDLEKIKTFAGGYIKPTFVINPEVQNKHKAVANARKEITDNKIGELYDTSESIKYNLQILKESGYEVSLTRLYQFTKDYSISTKKKVVKGYNPNLSIRENMKEMGCTKYQVEKARKVYLSHSTILS